MLSLGLEVDGREDILALLSKRVTQKRHVTLARKIGYDLVVVDLIFHRSGRFSDIAIGA